MGLVKLFVVESGIGQSFCGRGRALCEQLRLVKYCVGVGRSKFKIVWRWAGLVNRSGKDWLIFSQEYKGLVKISMEKFWSIRLDWRKVLHYQVELNKPFVGVSRNRQTFCGSRQDGSNSVWEWVEQLRLFAIGPQLFCGLNTLIWYVHQIKAKGLSKIITQFQSPHIIMLASNSMSFLNLHLEKTNLYLSSIITCLSSLQAFQGPAVNCDIEEQCWTY